MIENSSSKLYCYNHPNRETLLRCNRCNRPICTECAVLTETGYRCKECVRGQQKVFSTAQWYDIPVGMALAFVFALIGGYLIRFAGFFTIFIAPIVGVVIAEAVRWATRRRRSPRLFRLVTLSAAVGGLVQPLYFVVIMLLGGGGNILSLVWQAAFVILMTSSLYYRLTGIQIGR